ncbi:uncharacterized protein LOC130941134 [Arachis stenosperma]|uniref:uncharacterized protein LOC130941134 n=1 Tax=Arachis stenosperma TaxID=217475 RepID=UPI0025AB9CA8|nr:uncharacterized protein LOC130941134 [Arachis stenosperma]
MATANQDRIQLGFDENRNCQGSIVLYGLVILSDVTFVILAALFTTAHTKNVSFMTNQISPNLKVSKFSDFKPSVLPSLLSLLLQVPNPTPLSLSYPPENPNLRIQFEFQPPPIILSSLRGTTTTHHPTSQLKLITEPFSPFSLSLSLLLAVGRCRFSAPPRASFLLLCSAPCLAVVASVLRVESIVSASTLSDLAMATKSLLVVAHDYRVEYMITPETTVQQVRELVTQLRQLDGDHLPAFFIHRDEMIVDNHEVPDDLVLWDHVHPHTELVFFGGGNEIATVGGTDDEDGEDNDGVSK